MIKILCKLGRHIWTRWTYHQGPGVYRQRYCERCRKAEAEQVVRDSYWCWGRKENLMRYELETQLDDMQVGKNYFDDEYQAIKYVWEIVRAGAFTSDQGGDYYIIPVSRVKRWRISKVEDERSESGQDSG